MTPIMSLGTEVPVTKSVAEICGLLVECGADFISTQYDSEKNPTGICFSVRVKLPGGPLDCPMNFAIPARWEGALKHVPKPRNYGSPKEQEARRKEQARRIAWRNVYFWLKAQLSIIECEQAEIAEVFLPYAVTNDGNTTLYAALKKGNFQALQLGAGSK